MDNYMPMSTTDRHNNIISVLIGRMENQSLADVLVTRGGLQFDLRYLAI